MIATTSTPPAHEILIVDDDADIRDSLGSLLEGEGYAVACAANGREALDRLRAGLLPCLILLDLMMPVMDGLAFIAQQTADPTLAGIPVVVITAAGQTKTASLPRPVLSKPIQIETLLNTVARHC
jgi:CheY-like chemotaxis protein